MALERKDVRFKLPPQIHWDLVVLAGLAGMDIGEYVEALITPIVEKKAHEATVFVERTGRMTASGKSDAPHI